MSSLQSFPPNEPRLEDPLVLEILWSGPNSWPGSDYGWTWAYMMRHIYNLGLSNIDGDTFTLEIEDNLSNRLDATRPVGSTVPYIRIFGLDRFDLHRFHRT